MAKNYKRIFSIVLALLMLLALAGCGGSTSAPASPGTAAAGPTASAAVQNILYKSPVSPITFNNAVSGGILRVGTRFSGVQNIGFPFTMATNSCWEQIAACPAIETLARWDDSGKLVPWLADSWDIKPEALTFTIHIHPGVKFHDGTDFDAEALIWNLQQSTSNGRSQLKTISKYEAVDKNTVTLHLSAWDSAIAENVLYTCGWIVSPTAIKAHNMDWAAANPIGTGPFVFKKWERDVGVYFTKNANYWRKGEPYLDEVDICIYTDVTALSAALQTGKVDVVIPADASVALAWAKDKGGVTETGRTTQLTSHCLMMPSNNPKLPFYDVRVRQAIAYAIDSNAIAKLMSEQGGDYFAVNQIAIPGTPSYNDQVKGYPYNPEKAKQLLKEAGYEKGFTCPGYVIVSNNLLKQCADIVAAYLKDVGITVQNQNNDMTVISEMTAGKTKQLDGLVWFCTNVGANCTPCYSKTFLPDGDTYASITGKPAELTKAIADATQAKSDAELAKACQTMSKVMVDNCLIVPIALQNNGQCIAKYVHNMSFARGCQMDWDPEGVWMDKH